MQARLTRSRPMSARRAGIRGEALKQGTVALPAAATALLAAAPPALASEGIEPQLLALPVALLAIGGGAFALLKADAGFADFMRNAAVRDSNAIGAGYEPAIKSGRAKGPAPTTPPEDAN